MIHYETRRLPVFALVLDRPGKTGPQLQPYPDGSPCDPSIPTGTNLAPGPRQPVAGGFPAICGGYAAMQASVPGRVRTGARNVTIQIMADQFPGLGNGVDRPVVDQTGLIGTFDFWFEWTPELNGPVPAGSTFQPDPSGPTFLEALKEQLGLKLLAQTGPVDVLVIDHVEEPSPKLTTTVPARAESREVASAQPVDATPSRLIVLCKGRVFRQIGDMLLRIWPGGVMRGPPP